MKIQFVIIAALLALGGFAATRILKIEPGPVTGHGHGHGHDDHGDHADHDDHAHEAESAADDHGHAHPHDDHGHPHGEAAPALRKIVPTEGPRGGKLLRADGFSVEVTIFEDGVSPEFRLYAYDAAGAALAPDDITAEIELQRLDTTDHIHFAVQDDYLVGDTVVAEPHSFDVVVRATYVGQSAVWTYESYEGRATIAPEFARDGGIRTAIAGSQEIGDRALLYGEVLTDANREARVGARFPGVITAVYHNIGDIVSAGDPLAEVESNDSLRRYTITAPQAGLVTERAASLGAITGDQPLFVLSDTSRVWVQLHVYPGDVDRVRPGLPVTIRLPDSETQAEAVLGHYLPTETGPGQTRVIRLELANPDGHWTPGLRVHAEVRLPTHEADLAVETSALQSFRDFTVVFAQVGDTYEVRMLELGRRDDRYVEVLGGLRSSERYVTHNSYLVKADALKAGASHDH